MRDGMMSCLQWCAMAIECVGDKAYDSFNEMRATSIKERLINLAAGAAQEDGSATEAVERSLHFAENLARAEKADLHIVLPGAAFSCTSSSELAHKELLKLGFQLEDIEEVCRIVDNHADGQSTDSINFAVVHDALLLARREPDHGAVNSDAGDKYLTKTASTLTV